ncbi:hypothetical protein [Denitratisoma sp. DHT3]|uniref:hypothetical protein n=1 Tax=Denitratisoma sp. DHT3 TaxID=1981880 RepID=UPI00119CDBE5|nr:hypothetical protein [Denitratisoma sp. DHT3]
MIDLLADFYQSGNFVQMETIARSLLVAIPDDIVALQFLGLSLYLMGRKESAYRAFRRGAVNAAAPAATTIEPAAAISYREATKPGTALADGWDKISRILRSLGLHKPARSALAAARAARRLGGG